MKLNPLGLIVLGLLLIGGICTLGAADAATGHQPTETPAAGEESYTRWYTSFAALGQVNMLLACLGLLGGLMVPIIEWLDNQRKPPEERPQMSQWSFIVLPAFGFILVVVYELSKQNLQPIVALNVGMTAMIILKGMAAKSPMGDGPIPAPAKAGQGAKRLRVRPATPPSAGSGGQPP